MWQWVAVLAMWLMEGSYLPQLIRLYRVKEAEEFALLFPLLNVTGRFLVMLYSHARGEDVLALGFFRMVDVKSDSASAGHLLPMATQVFQAITQHNTWIIRRSQHELAHTDGHRHLERAV
ncbi:MAG: hypothetical protein C4335_12845 [Armatimonadota bacterium]